MSGHNEPAVAFGPEIIIEAFKPILEHEIEELKPLLPRIPRQATYQTVTLAPGQVTQLTGFDASRQAFQVWSLSYDAIVIGYDRSSVETALSNTTGSGADQDTGPYAVLPGSGAILQLRNQAPVWAKNTSAANTALVSFVSESHAIA